MQRPRFEAVPHNPVNDSVPCLSSKDEDKWTAVCACSTEVSLDLFEVALLQLVHHPEYNSTLILRSDIIEETEDPAEISKCVPVLKGMKPIKNIHRKLLPRRPGRDPSIEQHCTFYSAESDATSELPPPSCLILTPIVEGGAQLPYYHPAVHHIAFRYLQGSGDDSQRIRIEVITLPDAPDPADINSRLYRTCLALLETLHRYCWGALTNYKKRVQHDCLVSREEYQDLYLILREKYKHLVEQWQEATDPLKHVFEDIGIATYLMLLWKQGIFIGESAIGGTSQSDGIEAPWHSWPRPQAGFLDFGCGNGLLVHILVSEGYHGHGIDVRARTSWAHYPPGTTQAHLHVHALDPLLIGTHLPGEGEEFFEESEPLLSTSEGVVFLQKGTFIIANHADELTPWTPVLATLCGASGYLSIPCCSWTFDVKFEKPRIREYDTFFETKLSGDRRKDANEEAFIESLNLGGDAGSSSSAYSVYRIWLAKLSSYCGWKIECENLRIPSTRNWAIIGRRRDKEDNTEIIRRSRWILDRVKEREMFKTRKPEGKAGDH
ncbi:DUF1613-domain-containing protein [Schizopora paradoxa]|uniref:tRNA (uracil-O(2)-)-methyltransferase n=1 Tax=Schizopora paradoxa TaxID=27342 RepID=A0A0H2S4A8_9AGAM|nr:DUF1613-domain-containing protein [Schizopora paradoxa]